MSNAQQPIMVRLDCGFGNQLFQVAFGEWLRRRFGRRVVYDASGSVAADRFVLPAELCGDAPPVTDRSELGWRSAYWFGGKYNALLLQVARAMGMTSVQSALFLDDEARSERAPRPERAPVWAVGYWQNAAFVDAEVLKIIDHRLSALCPILAGSGADGEPDEDKGIAVHLRWGDYKSDERNRRRHGLLGPGYFRAALRTLGAELPVTVFSETAEAAKWLAVHCPEADVRYAGQRDMWQDFFGMSRFRRIVIANSSFSWWAATHDAAGEKQVVMPARWFALDERWGRNAARRLRRDAWVQVENDWL